MSVNMTVMTRRSVWRSGREPVTNSSQVSVNSCQCWVGSTKWSPPGTSTNRASGIRSATYRPPGDGHQRVAAGVHHERRRGDPVQERGCVEVGDAVDLATDVGLRGGLSLQAPVPAHERRVVRVRRAELIHGELRVAAPGGDDPVEHLAEPYEPVE
jgi:hypothetical protein